MNPQYQQINNSPLFLSSCYSAYLYNSPISQIKRRTKNGFALMKQFQQKKKIFSVMNQCFIQNQNDMHLLNKIEQLQARMDQLTQQIKQAFNRQAAIQHQFIWTNNDLRNKNTIRYYFMDLDQKKQKLVKKGFDEWKKIGILLNFQEVKNINDSQIRISFDYNKDNCSLVGRDNLNPLYRNKQTMNLNFRAKPIDSKSSFGIILHQIGHVLGLQHEHQNPNSGIIWNNDVVKSIYSRLSSKTIQQNILNFAAPKNKMFTSGFDPQSIMNYAFSASCFLKPEQLKQRGLKVNYELSKLDIEFVRSIYPQKGELKWLNNRISEPMPSISQHKVLQRQLLESQRYQDVAKINPVIRKNQQINIFVNNSKISSQPNYIEFKQRPTVYQIQNQKTSQNDKDKFYFLNVIKEKQISGTSRIQIQNTANFLQINSQGTLNPQRIQLLQQDCYSIYKKHIDEQIPNLQSLPENIRKSSRDQKLNQILRKKKIWTKDILKDNILYYYFLDNSEKVNNNKKNAYKIQEYKKLVKQAFQTWKNTGIWIQFQQTLSINNSHIRIGFDRNKPNYSLVGTDHILKSYRLQQTMNLNFKQSKQSNFSTILHQIGHALGRFHQHQNPNADIQWVKSQIQKNFPIYNTATRQENICRPLLSQMQYFGMVFDPHSIMNYQIPKACFNKPSILYREGIKKPTQLSQNDICFVKSAYPDNNEYFQPIESKDLQNKIKNSQCSVLVYLQNRSTHHFTLQQFHKKNKQITVFKAPQRQIKEKSTLIFCMKINKKDPYSQTLIKIHKQQKYAVNKILNFKITPINISQEHQKLFNQQNIKKKVVKIKKGIGIKSKPSIQTQTTLARTNEYQEVGSKISIKFEDEEFEDPEKINFNQTSNKNKSSNFLPGKNTPNNLNQNSNGIQKYQSIVYKCGYCAQVITIFVYLPQNKQGKFDKYFKAVKQIQKQKPQVFVTVQKDFHRVIKHAVYHPQSNQIVARFAIKCSQDLKIPYYNYPCNIKRVELTNNIPKN